MIELLDGIVAAFKGDADLTSAFPGGIHKDIAPAAIKNVDYATITAIPSPTTPTFNGAPLGQVRVQFTAWTNRGGEAAGTLATLIVMKFRANYITLSGGGITNINLNNTPVPRVQNQRDGTASAKVMCPIEFLYSVELAN